MADERLRQLVGDFTQKTAAAAEAGRELHGYVTGLDQPPSERSAESFERLLMLMEYAAGRMGQALLNAALRQAAADLERRADGLE